MSATYATPRTTSTFGLLGSGLAATAVACVATAAVAAAGNAAGISLELGGQAVPLGGFATLTAIFSVLGLVIAATQARFAGHPRRAFVSTTVVLTALSLVPDVLVDAATSTKALFMLTHLVAAAIVIPAVARKLAA